MGRHAARRRRGRRARGFRRFQTTHRLTTTTTTTVDDDDDRARQWTTCDEFTETPVRRGEGGVGRESRSVGVYWIASRASIACDLIVI